MVGLSFLQKRAHSSSFESIYFPLAEYVVILASFLFLCIVLALYAFSLFSVLEDQEGEQVWY